jgi:hypothetical protein
MKHLAQMLIVFGLIGYENILAQQTVAASGGNASGTGGTVSYTMGETVYTANISSSGTVAQGCQQPYEIFILTGLEEATGITIECEVYPNPSSDFVKLVVPNYESEDLGFRLYNSSGSLIKNNRITDIETVIEMGKLPPASYYLNIYDSQKEIKTFKLIKNQ